LEGSRVTKRAIMATSDTELEEQLLQAGNRLVDPPSSVDELLPLLDVNP